MLTRAAKLGLVLCALATVVVLVALAAWWVQPRPRAVASSLTPSPIRAERRAYDGAPPVIPHPPLGGACISCHAAQARELPGVGIAPPNPHLRTPGLSSASRCQQCHVFKNATDVLTASTFEPLTQDLRKGERPYATAPPVIAHGYFMREDCAACHAGATARPETRCTHPERLNCLQCHARSSQP